MPSSISSIEQKSSLQIKSEDNSQQHLMKLLQKEFISKGELNLKSNFAKKIFEKHIDKTKQQNENVKQNQQEQQRQDKKKPSSTTKQRSRHSKLSQFLQPISRCEEASSKNQESKNQLYQEKMQEEIIKLQASIYNQVKLKGSSPKQPQSALIGRKKYKKDNQLNLSSTLYDKLDLHGSQRIIPVTPNDFLNRDMPLNIFDENENLRNKIIEAISPDQQKDENKLTIKKSLSKKKDNISQQKSLQKSLRQLEVVELNKSSFDSRDCKHKQDAFSDDSHISLKDQDEIISQLKSNKELVHNI